MSPLQLPCDKAHSQIATVPHTLLHVRIDWLECSGVHHLYPAVGCPGWVQLSPWMLAGQPDVLRSSDSPSAAWVDTYSKFRSAGVRMSVALTIGKSSAEIADLVRQDIFAMLNGSMLASQFNWVRSYQNVPPYPVPRKYSSVLRTRYGVGNDTLQDERYYGLRHWVYARESVIPSFSKHLKAVKLAVEASSMTVREGEGG